jgi:hypothetical protein
MLKVTLGLFEFVQSHCGDAGVIRVRREARIGLGCQLEVPGCQQQYYTIKKYNSKTSIQDDY